MKTTKHRSAVWSVINWAAVRLRVYNELAIHPDTNSIEDSIRTIEAEYGEEKLFLKEAEELETLLIKEITENLSRDRKKEIKRHQSLREKKLKQIEKEENEREKLNSKIQIFGLDEMPDMDPEMMEELSKGIMDHIMGKKKKDEDEDEDEANASFYL